MTRAARSGTYVEDRSREMRVSRRTRPIIGAVACALAIGACVSQAAPAAKASDAARELNQSLRFGRMDIAAPMVAPAARAAFLQRRQLWGRTIRIFDVEMAGLEMEESTEAVIQVDYSWTPVDESTLRVTRVEQRWSDQQGNWLLVRERRISGEIGLFGEGAPEQPRLNEDAHFPTKVIQ